MNALPLQCFMSERASDALAGRPFVESDLYTRAQWDAAIAYAADTGDLSELEWMLDADTDAAAEGERAYRWECRTGKAWEPLAMTPVGLS